MGRSCLCLPKTRNVYASSALWIWISYWNVRLCVVLLCAGEYTLYRCCNYIAVSFHNNQNMNGWLFGVWTLWITHRRSIIHRAPYFTFHMPKPKSLSSWTFSCNSSCLSTKVGVTKETCLAGLWEEGGSQGQNKDDHECYWRQLARNKSTGTAVSGEQQEIPKKSCRIWERDLGRLMIITKINSGQTRERTVGNSCHMRCSCTGNWKPGTWYGGYLVTKLRCVLVINGKFQHNECSPSCSDL